MAPLAWPDPLACLTSRGSWPQVGHTSTMAPLAWFSPGSIGLPESTGDPAWPLVGNTSTMATLVWFSFGFIGFLDQQRILATGMSVIHQHWLL